MPTAIDVSEYTKWEDSVLSHMERAWDISRSDAQAIFDATHVNFIRVMFAHGYAPSVAARLMIEKRPVVV
jgi:hypothetical protein